eukprot:TRINITY_DN10285_c0_g1_i1.p1 TRINITY_DN10285_c0_g1~~TRINITY_DN10285_c0_g1_i1.p1  ORF type:complete len:605 (+),score=112.52 TRINITY_DN10285_c0_g1_i1:55-1869(+)
MVSVPVAASGVWKSLGLPDMSTTAFGASMLKGGGIPTQLSRSELSGRKPEFATFHGGLENLEGAVVKEDDDDRPEPIQIHPSFESSKRLRDAWLSEGGIEQAHRTALTSKRELTDSPTSRPLAPTSMSPRRHFLADLEDRRLGLHEGGSYLTKVLRESTADKSPTTNQSNSLNNRIGSGNQLSEVIDSIRRVAFHLRQLVEMNDVNEDTIPGYNKVAITDTTWRSSVDSMRSPLKQVASAVEAAIDPLYKVPSLKDRKLLRVDDALFGLSFLLQAASCLRDCVASAASLRPNFFEEKDLDMYESCVSFHHKALLFAMSSIRDIASTEMQNEQVRNSRTVSNRHVELDIQDRRELAAAILKELVPCPGSRRFWVSHIGPTALEVDSLQFEKCLRPYVCDVHAGQSNQIVDGIMRTLERDKKISLCNYGAFFGDVPIADALDTLANTGTANITYHLLMTPAAPWNPPTVREKKLPSPLRSEVLLPEDVLEVVRPKMKDVCLTCVNHQTRISELEAELQAFKKNRSPIVDESLSLSPQGTSKNSLFVPHTSPRSSLKKQPTQTQTVSVDLTKLMSEGNHSNTPSSSSTPARNTRPSSFQEWLRDNVR